MSMGGGRGGAAGRVGSRDAEVQRAENASAPRIPNLLGRIGELFRPFAGQLVTTIVLVLISAGLGVLPRCSPNARSTRGCSRHPEARMCRC
ncbi:hypothetical protein GCM10025869_07840 [Homoserinibacter gongjuensis]|uniref:Uncharacterized protein n=1 Tax=Homoserinibacter gongjuensis TaxID=1162968 RepID=A0ABQ6JPN7_9MICO|nr:hypothetical protein GCM10025869_07840 [Homoserinibacter gongjuensis]